MSRISGCLLINIYIAPSSHVPITVKFHFVKSISHRRLNVISKFNDKVKANKPLFILISDLCVLIHQFELNRFVYNPSLKTKKDNTINI